MDLTIPVSSETLKTLTRLDHFRGVWAGGNALPRDGLRRLREAARVQSVAASCRLAGIRLSETDVAAILRGEPSTAVEAREALGYAEALDAPFPSSGPLVTPAEIATLHARAMGSSGDPPEPTPWREQAYHLEMFDSEGRAMGRVFQTLPPRLIDETVEGLVTWLEFELRKGDEHPVLVIGTFLLHVVAACPFPRGNGRIVNLLAVHLLRRAGYDHIPYASLERILLEKRQRYFEAFDAAETHLWSGQGNLEPWLSFFLDALETHRERIEAKLDVERRALEFSPLQRRILEAVREHGTVGAGLLIESTGANRNTLKDNLRKLVDRGVLERMGERRGARYRLATGEPSD